MEFIDIPKRGVPDGFDTEVNIYEFIGKTFTDIAIQPDSIVFYAETGELYLMFHPQECCESVTLEDVRGEWDDLIGSPVLKASEDSNYDFDTDTPKDTLDESFTWTFYTIATIKGTVVLRWYGQSNGYYSESVEIWKKVA